MANRVDCSLSKFPVKGFSFFNPLLVVPHAARTLLDYSIAVL